MVGSLESSAFLAWVFLSVVRQVLGGIDSTSSHLFLVMLVKARRRNNATATHHYMIQL